MVFSSIVFLFTFLPILLLVYFLVPRRLKNPALLIASLIFYAWGEPVYIFLMLLSIGFNYVCGLDIARHLDDPGKARKSLIFDVVVNLLILGFFKYEGFLIDSLNLVLPFDIPYRALDLPVGISFYTFQILSYIIDVYRGTVEAQKNILDFALYVTMFPQLIAGPIVQYSDIERQLREREESWEKFGEGAMFFIRGLVKKALLANSIGMVFDEVIALKTGQVSMVSAWLGCAAYTFQIYFDFGGYSDMAIGLGKMFGFEFRANFFYPYTAQSITEFWRRWHISLGAWFREYVYIPLGGNRVPTAKHIRNIMVVWALTGLWHGAAWNFVAWGLYYGILLLIEKYALKKILPRLPAAVRHVGTMLLVMIGWVFFFSDSLGGALSYLRLMFGAGVHGFADREAFYLLKTNMVLWVLLFVSSGPFIYQKYARFIHRDSRVRNTRGRRGIGEAASEAEFYSARPGGRAKPRAALNCAVYAVLFLLCVAYLVTESYNPFLYFRF